MSIHAPAPGYRDFTSGISGGVGYRGYSWSSAVNGIYGADLDFYSQYLNASDSDYRTHGRQLRCLSE
ncbi:hypothetical protein [uncultured Rikenella sp.]|uniref:hypothetical protein n=1 Tax=uncultured Rikenella sp. TaxID=368003 RepID=UPI0025E5D5DB|nr:hypothetical protein [uncultured Rikenella sp.]